MRLQGYIKSAGTFDFESRFPTENSVREYFEAIRFERGICCSRCKNHGVWRVRGGAIYTCKSCRKQFTLRTGTIMEESKVPLRKWLYAIYLMTKSEEEISSVRLAKEMGVTQKSAWLMIRKIQNACRVFGLLVVRMEANREDASHNKTVQTPVHVEAAT